MIAQQMAMRLNEDKRSNRPSSTQHAESISTVGEDKEKAFSNFNHLIERSTLNQSSNVPSYQQTPTLTAQNSLNFSPKS